MISLFELSMKLSGYDIARATKKLDYIKSFSKDEFNDWQSKKKWKIAKFHYDNNQFYKKKVGNFFPEKWDDFPIMKKKDFQGNLYNKLSNSYTSRNIYISNTSGSSGNPLFFAKSKDAHAMDFALIKVRYNCHGLKLNSKQARFYGIPLEGKKYYIEKIKDWIMNRTRFSVFDLSESKLDEFYRKLKSSKFEYIYGYTNSLLIFAKYLVQNNLVLNEECPTIKCCIVTAELLFEDDEKILSEGFGMKIINEYGASEVGVIGFMSNNKKIVVSDETLFCEINNIDSLNDMGSLLITDLDNKAMPFIKYDLGDMVSFDLNLLHGKYNKIINKLYGRENDIIKLPSGKISPGFTLYYVSKSILESNGDIKEYIIRQTKIDEFIFDIVTDFPITSELRNEIELKMEQYLEPNLRIIIKRVEKIRKTRSGKIKHFISEII